MIKEAITTGKTIDIAVEKGVSELGVQAEKTSFEVLEEPKRGILGIGSAEAKVRVFILETPATRAVEFIEGVIKNMGIEATVVLDGETDEAAEISVNGEDLGLLIGRRGDVLDSLQYLATLAANLRKPGYYRVTLDIKGYREKRAETLRNLARRMSEKVLKYKKSFALEPMSSYERRIIHSECQSIQGVTTRSVGDGADRKVIISPEKNKDKQ